MTEMLTGVKWGSEFNVPSTVIVIWRQLRVSSDGLEEPGIKPRDALVHYKESGLSTTPK